MIRGVNRQIIEINDTQNEYFEKAIFYVRPDKNIQSEKKLNSMAIKFIEDSSPVAVKQQKRKRYRISRRVLWFLLFAMTATTVLLLITRFV